MRSVRKGLSRQVHSRGTGTLRTKAEQWWYVLYTIGGKILAVSLLWPIYPGWAASIGPQGWHWLEGVAHRTMGEPTLWDGGIRLMRAGNPKGWQAIMDAADMRQANRDAIAACERATIKAKEPVRCSPPSQVLPRARHLRERKKLHRSVRLASA